METLIFQLQAPLSSWGEVAVGEYRPTAEYPSQSGMQGLIAAALGIRRDDDLAQTAVRTGYRFAVAVLSQGRLLRDYHTSQVPSRADLKKRPHATRKDELAIPKQDLNTILSTRDYRQEAASLVAVQLEQSPPYSLWQLADALRAPKFSLYAGRKSCPLATPLHPCILTAETVNCAFAAYQEKLDRLWQESLPGHVAGVGVVIQKIIWGDDFDGDIASIGVGRNLTVTRKDQVITRNGWQFADRTEHIALLGKE